MKSSARNIQMTSYDDLFSVGDVAGTTGEKVQEIALGELFPFKGHPFKVLDDEAMEEMVESIRLHGVLVPGIARPRAEGGYELLAGHRRRHALELAGETMMPVIIRELDGDESTLFMVDSNLQRESLLPSERAFAYKMKLDAMKRQAGRPSKENLSQVGTQKRSDQLLADQVGQSRNQIQRYIRLTELISPLLDLVDEGRIAFRPAVELSYLQKAEQESLLESITYEDATPSLAQAIKMKAFSKEGRLNGDVILSILSEEKPNQKEKFTFRAERLRKFIPASIPPEKTEDYVLKALEHYHRYRERQRAQER